jgi:hypothetical protein
MPEDRPVANPPEPVEVLVDLLLDPVGRPERQKVLRRLGLRP